MRAGTLFTAVPGVKPDGTREPFDKDMLPE